MQLKANALQCIRGEQLLFEDLHCTIEAGSILQICAENGAGKTSLLRILCGLSTPDHGEVLWNGIPIVKQRTDYYRALAYCGHQNAVNGALTPLQNLQAASALWGRPSTMSSHLALQRLAMQDCMQLPCRLLSAGQLKRLQLAKMLMRSGGIWMLDEPATALDEGASQLLEQMLVEQVTARGIVIFTSHRPIQLGQLKPEQLHLAQFR